MKRFYGFLVLCLVLWSAVLADSKHREAIDQIKDEGINKSQAMTILSYLTDVIGPRLTASPNLKNAHDWTRGKLQEWGLQNAKTEAWGEFGRGWTLKRFTAEVIEPHCMPLIAFPKAWSPGTDGPITAEVVYVDAKNEQELEVYKGTLKGKIVLHTPAPVSLQMLTEPLARRVEVEESGQTPTDRRRRERARASTQPFASPQMDERKFRLYQEEGVAMVIETSVVGEGVAIRVMSARVSRVEGGPNNLRPWSKGATILPQVVISPEQYNRLVRMIQLGERPKISMNLQVEYQDNDLMGYNTLAELPGTDLKDEIVMLGAHIDSWHAATGATDNGAGVAVCMEAIRILKASGLQPRRTIRIALWDGEEQGLLGSRAYVSKNFARRETVDGESKLVKTPEFDKFCAYFNYDNGAGRIRGFNLEGIEAMRPIFTEWMEPFKEMGVVTLSPGGSGGSDQVSFNSVGLPGFQPIQDPLEYFQRSWHTNQDFFDRAPEEDMKFAATVLAAMIYQAAMRDEKLPRRPQNALVDQLPPVGHMDDDHDHDHDHDH